MNKFFFENRLNYRLARHLSFFILTVFVFTLVLFFRKGGTDFFEILVTVFINALFFFGYAYLTIFILIPVFLLNNRFFCFALFFLIVGIGLSALKLLCSFEIFYASIAPENINGQGLFNLRFILVNTKDMSFIVALFCVAKYTKDYLYAENQRKILEVQINEARKKLLQTQFDPHFLFNTINNLYAISLLDPDKTRQVIGRIKKMLLFIVEKSQKKFVDITDEIELIENYVQLEKLRYGDRLEVVFEKGSLEGKIKIPPMVFFVLSENCFRHGSSLDAGTPWIWLGLKETPAGLAFEAKNSKPQNSQDGNDFESGVSLSNLKQRLDLLYPGKYELRLKNGPGVFEAKLILNLK